MIEEGRGGWQKPRETDEDSHRQRLPSKASLRRLKRKNKKLRRKVRERGHGHGHGYRHGPAETEQAPGVGAAQSENDRVE